LCHVAFALLQSKEDAHNKIRSVGDVGDDHRKLLDHLTIVKHVAETDEEMSLQLGDIVTDVENMANGYSRVSFLHGIIEFG
jgi:phage host-nuclease inhibitor protein Gam